MSKDLFEKFPDLVLHGKHLIWDLRQNIKDIKPEQRRVYIKSFLDDASKQKLRALPASEHIEDKHPEMTLGYDAAAALGYPSRDVQVVAVTGTNGKSTTVSFLGQLISLQIKGPVPVLGTIGLQIFENGQCRETLDTGYTTPDAPALQNMLRHCVTRGWKYLVMEASSQGWSLGRLAGLEISALGFTNLTQDHLDYHGTMEAYAEAKQSIFVKALRGVGVLHVTSEAAGKTLVHNVEHALKERVRLVDYRTDFKNLQSSLDGHEFDFDQKHYRFHLVGLHNLENLRVAFELYHAEFGEYPGVPNVEKLLPAKGRLELAGAGARPYVYVDYAHTPDALEKSLIALRSLKRPTQKLWVIFGCGGDRDPMKRPMMGAIAANFADEVVITSDNPRTEEPTKILRQIEVGLTRAARLVEVDRRKAIRWALESMASDDVLLIAGKGHEEYQILGTQKVPFSDFDEVLAVLNQNFTT